jgi:hypothetical protein
MTTPDSPNDGLVEYVRARQHLDVVDARQRGDVRRRAGRDHHVLRIERPVTDGEPPVVKEPRGVVKKGDAVSVGEPFDGGAAVRGEVRRVFVFPPDDGLEVDVGKRPREPVVVARREPVFAGRKHLF